MTGRNNCSGLVVASKRQLFEFFGKYFCDPERRRCMQNNRRNTLTMSRSTKPGLQGFKDFSVNANSGDSEIKC